MTLRKYLLLPQIGFYAVRAPRDQRQAWDRFWAGVQRTGSDGEVFWDTDVPAEMDATLARLRAHADLSLPLVDLGCGNGRQARMLTSVAPRVLALDRSEAAIERARAESAPPAGDGATAPTLDFRVGDAAEPGLGERLHEETGDVNVHIRGMLHVVEPRRRPDVVRTIEALLGARGTAYICETDAATDPLSYLMTQGATPTSMPRPLRRLVAAGLRPPSHFGQEQVARYFPDDRFRVLEQGPVALLGVPLQPGDEENRIPGHYAVLRGVG